MSAICFTQTLKQTFLTLATSSAPQYFLPSLLTVAPYETKFTAAGIVALSAVWTLEVIEVDIGYGLTSYRGSAFFIYDALV